MPTADPWQNLSLPDGVREDQETEVWAHLETAHIEQVADTATLAAIAEGDRWTGRAYALPSGDVYIFDAASSAAPGTGVVAPDVGTGRWISVDASGTSGAAAAQADATQALADAADKAEVWTSGALQSGARFVVASVISDGSGDWSVTAASLGLTTLLGVWPAVVLSTGTVHNRAWATLATLTGSGASGYTLRGDTVVLAAPTIVVAPNTPVSLLVVGLP